MGAMDARNMYSNSAVNKQLHTVASMDFSNLSLKSFLIQRFCLRTGAYMGKYLELFDLSYLKHRWEAVPYLRRMVDRFSRQRTGLAHRAVNTGYEVEKIAHGQVSLPIIAPPMSHTHSSVTKGRTMVPLTQTQDGIRQ